MTKEPKGETLQGHMGPGPWDGAKLEELVVRAVRQVTDRNLARPIVAEALAKSGFDGVPRSAALFSAFVLGPLHATLRERAGAEVAERAISILRPILKSRSELELGPMEGGEVPTVLVVDEDIVVRARLLSILTTAGYRAVSAPDSNVGLAMCVRCRPDVIVSEMGLGRVRGNQLAALLNVAFRDEAPPIVLLSGDESDESERVPGVIVLRKPVDRRALLQAVDLCFRRTSAETA